MVSSVIIFKAGVSNWKQKLNLATARLQLYNRMIVDDTFHKCLLVLGEDGIQ